VAKFPEPIEVHVKLGDVVAQVEAINVAAKALQALTPEQAADLLETLDPAETWAPGMEHVRAIVKAILEAER
jgi:hypothetical protein